MVCFDRLRDIQQKLQALKGLVGALQAAEGFMATAEALHAEHTTATQEGLKIAQFVREMVVARAASEALQRCEFATFIRVLDPQDKTTLGIGTLDASILANFQKRQLVNAVFGLCKVEPEKNNKACTKVETALTSLRSLVAMIPLGEDDAYVQDEALRTELGKLNLLLKAPASLDKDILQSAERVRDDLVNNKNGCFNKALTTFSTGIEAKVQAERILEKFIADKGHLIVLRDTVRKVHSLNLFLLVPRLVRS